MTRTACSRSCPDCGGTDFKEQGDGLTCENCGFHAVPCSCGGWFTKYVGIVKGDDATECPDCEKRYYAAAPSWRQ